MPGEARQTKQYLGDSVYVDFEDGMLKLTTENGYPDDPRNVIYLESHVYGALVDYVKWLRDQPRLSEGAGQEGGG